MVPAVERQREKQTRRMRTRELWHKQELKKRKEHKCKKKVKIQPDGPTDGVTEACNIQEQPEF